MKENERTVTSILSMNPGCQAQYVLQRMIGASISNDLFTRFYNSKWMEIIKSEQQEDGSFGRFHTMDSSVKKRIPTTERAVDSIKYLLLPRGNDFVDKLCLYMENILSKSLPWPDGFEQNKYYKAAQPLFVAAKLSVFGSQNKEFHSLFNTWHTILSESFSSGEYSKDRNNEVAKELLGTEIDDSYIGLHSIYTIEFFSNTQASLEAPLKEAYLHWLHTNNRSIHYTNINFTFIDNYTFSD